MLSLTPSENQLQLFKYEAPTSLDLNLEDIHIVETSASEIVRLQAEMSRVKWRPAPGRRLALLVKHKEDIIGIIYLTTPVFVLGVRDTFLHIPKDPKERGRVLNCYMDMSVCVAAQPLGWYWNIGKLLALTAASSTVRDMVLAKYPNAELLGITTTAVWGRSTQYNRVMKLLGYTKGWGHGHISDERYAEMKQWLIDHGHEVPKIASALGGRIAVIKAYNKLSGDYSETAFHGNQRGVYYSPVSSMTFEEVKNYWYTRWGLPRYTRVKDQAPPYHTGKEDSGRQYKRSDSNPNP